MTRQEIYMWKHDTLAFAAFYVRYIVTAVFLDINRPNITQRKVWKWDIPHSTERIQVVCGKVQNLPEGRRGHGS